MVAEAPVEPPGQYIRNEVLHNIDFTLHFVFNLTVDPLINVWKSHACAV